eukprot:1909415-Pyramimonas_sp.AAC.1
MHRAAWSTRRLGLYRALRAPPTVLVVLDLVRRFVVDVLFALLPPPPSPFVAADAVGVRRSSPSVVPVACRRRLRLRCGRPPR